MIYEDTLIAYNGMLDNIKSGIPISKKDRRRLSKFSISLFKRLAPSSLVVMNYCLRILLSDSPKPKLVKELPILVSKLSYRYNIWSEGYSSWLSVRPYLEAVCKLNYGEYLIKSAIESIDDGFLKTSYARKGFLYPAPFGNLKQGDRLQDQLQKDPDKAYEVERVVGPVTRIIHSPNKIVYEINPIPVGLNTAVPCESYQVVVIEGFAYGFKWYTSEYDKYFDEKLERPSKLKKLKDSLRGERLWKKKTQR